MCLVNPANHAEGVEKPDEAGGGEHHQGAKETRQKPDLLLVRREDLFLFCHGVGTSLGAAGEQSNVAQNGGLSKRPRRGKAESGKAET